MTMIEKLVSNKLLGDDKTRKFVKPGDAVLAQVDGGYSHEFTTAQVHTFLEENTEKTTRFQIPPNSLFLRIICFTLLAFQDLGNSLTRYRPQGICRICSRNTPE